MHSQYSDTTDLLIMQVIATDIGENDEPARTSYRGIAERTGAHYNTVSARVAGLVQRGHLLSERQGKYLVYRLPFDCQRENKRLSQRPEGDCDNQGGIEELSQFAERLSQRIEELSQSVALIVTTLQRGIVTEVREERREEEGKEEEAVAPAPDPFIAAIKAYEENLAVITPVVSEGIAEALRLYGEKWVIDAIAVSARRNKRNWSYVEGILRNWHAKGHQDRDEDRPARPGVNANGSQPTKDEARRERNLSALEAVARRYEDGNT